MTRTVFYRDFKIDIQKVAESDREHLYEVHSIYGSGPSCCGNSFVNPYYLTRKLKKRIDNWHSIEADKVKFL
ncbi:hypothetical protein LJB95_00865 [Paludibacteraceae bacterium OttesenSCG-928-F17]|nr:hypothetical protein [Paludibacteraceae bacterium OttesenSCG-928-F17]